MRTLLHSNGMTGVRDSERIMSLNVDRKVVMTIGWVRFDSFPDYRIIAINPAPTEEARRTCWVNKLNIKPPSKKEIWIEGR